MESAKLSAIYKYVFGRKFSNSMDDKIRLQKVVYALNECNMAFGDYVFMWDEHGPFSPELSNDIKRIDPNETYRLSYDSSGRRILSKIKRIFTNIPSGISYSEINWIETLMSIHYIQNYIIRNNNQGKVLAYLKQCKPYLSSDSDNIEAYRIVQAF